MDLLSLTFIYHLLSCVFAMILLPSNRQYLLVRASCRSPYTGSAPPQRSSAQNCQVGSLSGQKLGRGRKWKQLSTKNVAWEKVGGLVRGKSEKLQQKWNLVQRGGERNSAERGRGFDSSQIVRKNLQNINQFLQSLSDNTNQ